MPGRRQRRGRSFGVGQARGILGIVDADDFPACECEPVIERARLCLDLPRWDGNHPHPAWQVRRGEGVLGGCIALLKQQTDIGEWAGIVELLQPVDEMRGDPALAVQRHEERDHRQAGGEDFRPMSGWFLRADEQQ